MEVVDKSFDGLYEVVLDEAGRIAFPRDLRNVLETDKVVVTMSADPCLWLFTEEAWKKRQRSIVENANMDTAEGRDIRRRNVAHRIDLDRQGRMLIPPSLRDHSSLKKDCVVLGLVDYVEIWDKECYAAHTCSQEKYYERSEAFAQKGEVKNAGNSAHSGTFGGDADVSRSEGQG